jgi:23S rRNA pseudouridine1911/1915/1917 synthase
VAKTDRAHAALAAQFADHGRTGPLRRGYLAFVWGAPDRPRGTVEAPIDRHPHARDKMAVRQGGRTAITHWEVLERYPGAGGAASGPSSREPVASLLACTLETGRTHQIRVHLTHIGHPLVGDSVYGPGYRTKVALLPPTAADAVEALGRQALHAYLLTIQHPVTGDVLEFRSELPPDLARLRACLGAGATPGSNVGPNRGVKSKA